MRVHEISFRETNRAINLTEKETEGLEEAKKKRKADPDRNRGRAEESEIFQTV